MLRRKVNKKQLREIAFFLSAVVFAGCSLVGGSYALKHADDYEVTAPTGWKKIAKAESDQAYELTSGSLVTVVSSCDHRSEAPLEVLSNQLLIGSRKRKIVSRKKESFGGHDGLRTVAEVKMGATPIALELFVTKSEGCVFDFSLMRREAIPESDSQEFQTFLATFSYGKNKITH